MTGKITRASAEQYAKERNLEPIQIDGIPEGFSFIQKNLRQINNVYDYGNLIGLRPNHAWSGDDHSACWKPIILATLNPTQEQIDIEIETTKKNLLKLFKN